MKKITCGYVVDDEICHSIWVAAYTNALKTKSLANSLVLAERAVNEYNKRWRIHIPEGADPGAFLNSIQAATDEIYAKRILP